VRCNRHVRFDLMLGRVLELGFEALATGHYARILASEAGPELHAARDGRKDQSYMLYHLDRERLLHLRFPLGELEKTSVRELAADMGLPVARKAESQEICFVPRGRTGDHLRARLGLRPGPVLDPSGEEVGRHGGAAAYTVGQRSGLGSLRAPGPWYVTRVDTAANQVHVGRREHLEITDLRLEDVTFVAGSEIEPLACEARLRYHAPSLPATYERGRLRLAVPFLAAAPGQAAVLYDGTRVLGGGTIAA
jgi:tRNA-specific 2-thiouridylase